jgi:hypothetical protein
MDWEEYCIKKKIDSAAFKAAEPQRWAEFKTIFEQMHPNSFTEQKKFLINDLRRHYHLTTTEQKPEAVKPTPAIKIPSIKKG